MCYARLARVIAMPHSGGDCILRRYKKDSSQKLLRQGRKEVRKGNYDKALALYREILNTNTAHIQARLGVSFAYLKMGDFLHCLEELRGFKAEQGQCSRPRARRHVAAAIRICRRRGVSTSASDRSGSEGRACLRRRRGG